MARPFAKLRGRMLEYGYDQPTVARKLLIGVTTVGNKINAHYPWTLDEQYALMDLLQIPYEDMHVYFPKGGHNEPGVVKLSAVKGGKAARGA